MTLSVAFITLVATTLTPLKASPTVLLKFSLAFQMVSLFFGLIVQHQITMGPLRHLQQAEKLESLAIKKGDDSPIELRRLFSKAGAVSYRLQWLCFLLSFLLASAHFVV